MAAAVRGDGSKEHNEQGQITRSARTHQEDVRGERTRLPRSGFVQQFVQAEAALRLGSIQAFGTYAKYHRY
jgi:hypothetical protein